MKNKEHFLSILIVIGLVLGIFVGQWMFDPSWTVKQSLSEHQYASWLRFFEFIGFTIFMGLLKMLIIPLIAVSVVVGVTSVGDFRELGRLGTWTLIYYFGTMLIAVTTGLLAVNILQPGSYMEQAAANTSEAAPAKVVEKAAGGLLGILENLVSLMIPKNITAAMTEGKTLSIIVFFAFFGVVLTTLGEKKEPLVKLFESSFEVLMKMVQAVLWVAPLGVFALMAWSIARIGLQVFGDAIGVYMLTVTLGLIVHAFVTLPLVLALVARTNPFAFMRQMKDALFMALGTNSSSATLPVSMECAVEKGGVSKRAAGLVLPLGATINMDGTALYEAVAVVFFAQAYGIDLGLTQMIVIAVTATIAAIGAAGIPSAGLVTMVIVVDVVNDSLLQANPQASLIPVAAIGLIIGVDRILDSLRTTVNVWGDAVGAKLITQVKT